VHNRPRDKSTMCGKCKVELLRPVASSMPLPVRVEINFSAIEAVGQLIDTVTAKNPAGDLGPFADYRFPEHKKGTEISHRAGHR
jgi:hypothetical protein